MSLELILEPQKLFVRDSDFPVSVLIGLQLAVSPERRATLSDLPSGLPALLSFSGCLLVAISFVVL
jgi:hypothetical protein